MTQEEARELTADTDGLATYEYIANHIDDCEAEMGWLADNIIRVDLSGQFCASAARYLNAVGADKFAAQIKGLVSAAIGKDREHRYLADLAASIYGADYQERAQELSATDDNFRRLYKRLFPSSAL